MEQDQGACEANIALPRRRLLATMGVAAAVGLFGFWQWSGLARAEALTKGEREKLTPDEILARGKQGNERFRSGRRKERNFLREQQTTATGQHPAAIVLGCIDSRAPVEVILDLGIGDTFNARVAGNIVNEDILGSMEYACAVAGSKVVLVMGHTACGAVKGAIDNVQLGNLTGLLNKLRPAIEATHYDGERSSKNAAFVNAVARKNVELTIAEIRVKSPVLQELETSGRIKIAGAMYDVSTGLVTLF